MRFQPIYAILLGAALTWNVTCAAKDDGAEAGAGDDLDLDDIDDEEEDGEAASGIGGGMGAGAVEDFDADMPEKEQETRMKGCFAHTMRRVKARRPQLQDTLKRMMENEPDQSAEKQQQAANTIIFSWMQTCYLNVDEANVKTASSMPDDEMSEELEQEVFLPKSDRPQQVQQASERQWKLLQKVMMSEAAKQEKRNPGGASQQQPEHTRTSYEGGSASAQEEKKSGSPLYAVLLLMVIFGIILLVLHRLSQAGGAEKSPKKERKSDKKAKRN